MKKLTHYLTHEMSISKIKGVAACGIYVSREDFGDNITHDREDVKCERCKATNIFNKVKEQQTCSRCGKIVGCDYHDQKHKCDCISGK